MLLLTASRSHVANAGRGSQPDTARYSQIQPALTRPDLGNVTHRFLVWLIHRKIMIQQVWRNVELVIADHHIAPLHSALFWQDRYSGNFQMGDTNVCST